MAATQIAQIPTAPGGFSLPGTVVHAAAGTEIFAEGSKPDSFFKMLCGVARVSRILTDGRRQIQDFPAAGDIFGLDTDGARQTAAEAVSDCTLLAYRRPSVEALARLDGKAGRLLFNFAMQELSRAQAHGLLLGRRAAAEKMAGFLLILARRSADGHGVTLAMTRQDIADHLALTSETVSRTLSQFERDGLIALVSTRDLRLRNPAALEALTA